MLLLALEHLYVSKKKLTNKMKIQSNNFLHILKELDQINIIIIIILKVDILETFKNFIPKSLFNVTY